MVRGPRSFAVVVVALLALRAGCGSAVPGPEPAGVAGSEAFPVTITHKYGSTTIPARPERIVTLSFEEDLFGQIGIAPVGHADNTYAPGQPYPWQVGAVDLTRSVVVRGVDGEIALEKLC